MEEALAIPSEQPGLLFSGDVHIHRIGESQRFACSSVDRTLKDSDCVFGKIIKPKATLHRTVELAFTVVDPKVELPQTNHSSA